VERSMSIAASRGQTVTVVFVDLDGFKVVNDTFGHPAGDALLIELARRLGSTLRVEDTFARLGGDEFALLLEPGIDLDATLRALTAQLLDPFIVEGTDIRLSMSLGVADSAPFGPGATVDELLRNADIALFRSKHDRSRSAVRFEPAMLEAAATRLQMLTDLRRAVDDNEFVVWLQPIVDLSTAQVQGFEALVRWEHPTSGLIPPLAFIPLAEESGLIGKIGELVLRGAASAIVEEHQLHGTAFPVNVNVSARQFEDPGFSALVERVLFDTEMSSDALILEITESAVMRDPESARLHLQRLASIGVKIALDDFGTGHSSLAALSRFPLDILKVDRSFITPRGSRRPMNATT
jgi:diguanylate cyclase (GGDEF)-like protein